jgi:hypothetical protein
MAIGGSLWSIDEESELDAAFCGTAGAGGGCSADWLEWELDDDDFLAAGDGGRAAGAAGVDLAGADDDDNEREDAEEMEGCNSFTTAGLCGGADSSIGEGFGRARGRYSLTGEGFGCGGATFGDGGLLDDFSAEAAACGGQAKQLF